MRVNTIQTVEFGSSRDSVQQANEVREAAFEQALSDAERADSLRSDEAAASDQTDEVRSREADDHKEESDEAEPGTDEDPDDEATDKDDDKAESDARQYDTGQALDVRSDVAALPTGPVSDRLTNVKSSGVGGSKKGPGVSTAALARSARTLATQSLAATPVAGTGAEVAATPTATAGAAGSTPTPTAGIDAVQAPTAVEGAARAGEDGRATTTSDTETSTRNKPLTAKTSSARFIDPRTLQAIEAQRESVFRQIAMRLTPEGGEMRVRLDPPELGEVDVQMVVEKGNVMRLVVVAERPEMADMLERHVDELRQTLEDQGITVSDASIHARDDRAADRGLFGDGTDWAAADRGDDDSDRDVSAAPSGGYITSEGLDFWV